MGERVRFSPSPSGTLHVGGARTALYNWLIARQTGGSFVVRIEDTDAMRSDHSHGEAILDDLEWLGMIPDESPRCGGPHAPYLQSERHALHREALSRLAATAHAYPCFCTPEVLEEHRVEDLAEGIAPRYRGTCRGLSAEQRDRRIAAGEAHAWRFATERTGHVDVEDEVHGTVTFESSDMGDFIIARSDGSATYDLACVADDIEMGITLVLRGDDHLPNTARQMVMYEALGATPPRFAHVPLVHGTDGRPLSKSEGAAGVRELRDAGYLPAAVLNHLALIGWTDTESREISTPEELIERFDLTRVSRSAGAHDIARLDWLNSRHIRMASVDALLDEFEGLLGSLPDWLDRRALVETVRDEVHRGSEIADIGRRIADDPVPDDEARIALQDEEAARVAVGIVRALEDHPIGGAPVLSVRAVLADLGVRPRTGMPVVRAALTGRAHGLPVDDVIRLLGPQRAAHRLRAIPGFDSAREGRR